MQEKSRRLLARVPRARLPGEAGHDHHRRALEEVRRPAVHPGRHRRHGDELPPPRRDDRPARAAGVRFEGLSRQREPDLADRVRNRLESVREDYPDRAYFSAMNLLDSHDTERLLWTLTPGAENRAAREHDAANLAEGKSRQRLAALVQLTMPGAPTIYYGDEVALTGDDDPDDRRTYPWADDTRTRRRHAAPRHRHVRVLQAADVAPLGPPVAPERRGALPALRRRGRGRRVRPQGRATTRSSSR